MLVVGTVHGQAQMAVEFAAQRKQASAAEAVRRRKARQKPQVSPQLIEPDEPMVPQGQQSINKQLESVFHCRSPLSCGFRK